MIGKRAKLDTAALSLALLAGCGGDVQRTYADSPGASGDAGAGDGGDSLLDRSRPAGGYAGNVSGSASGSSPVSAAGARMEGGLGGFASSDASGEAGARAGGDSGAGGGVEDGGYSGRPLGVSGGLSVGSVAGSLDTGGLGGRDGRGGEGEAAGADTTAGSRAGSTAGGAGAGGGGLEAGTAGSAAACEASVDFTTDTENCGTCGYSCEGGGCSAGLCTPASVYTTSEIVRGLAASGGRLLYPTAQEILEITPYAGSAPIMTTDASTPFGVIATDGSFVYYEQSSGVYRAGLSGQNPTTIAVEGSLPTINGGYLYYQSGDRLVRRVDGPTNTGSTNVVEIAMGLALRDFRVYGALLAYAIADQGYFAKDDTTASAHVRDFDTVGPYDYAAIEEHIYFLTGSGIERRSFGSADSTTLGSFSYGSGQLVGDGDGVYALVHSYGAQGSCSQVSLWHLPSGSDAPVQRWSTTQTCSSALATDDEYVYFAAYPKPSAAGSSDLALPTVFRMKK